MACIGKQLTMGFKQVFNLGGCCIETCGQLGNLILALHFNPGAKITGSQGFDPNLQALKPAGETPHNRVGAQCDYQCNGAEKPYHAKG